MHKDNRATRVGFLIGLLGLALLLFACQQDVRQEREGEAVSATLGAEAGSVRLESGAQATFEAGFFSQEAEVTFAPSPPPQTPPESAGQTYAESVKSVGPGVTLTLPYKALGDLTGAFAERKKLLIRLPEADTDAETSLEVVLNLPDGTERFYLEPKRDEPDANTVTLNAFQFKNGAEAGTVRVRVRRVSAAQTLVSQAVPSGFVLEDVVTGLNQGVVFDFAPDGRIFIGEKGGAVRVFENGQLKNEPFIDLSDEVNSRHDRGMLGLAVHPDFPAQPYVYLLFTYDPPEVSGTGAGGPDGNGARVSRLVRVTADEAQGYSVALPGSERVLLGTNSTYANIGNPNERNGPPSCEEGGVYVRDCLPADEQSHTIGTVRFGPDGSLFVSNGDGANYTKTEPYTTRALSLDSLAGKVIRIDPVTGEGYANNPFYNGDPNSNRSKVYSLGLRNPFRFTLNPATGEPFIGDVGRGTWEEVNTGKGANFGWPCFEGGNGENLQQGGFRALDVCQTFYEDERATPPLYSYTRSGTSASVQVGDFYTGTRYPEEYRDALFITDYNQRWIRTLTFEDDGSVADVNDFGTEQGVVQMSAGPGGDLYLMNVQEGKLKRLRYTKAGNTPPEARASATSASGEVPLTVSFRGADSTDADGDPLTYAWDFGDGATSDEANPTHTYEEMSLYRARLSVTDPAGASATDTVLVEAGTTQPVAVILSPEDGATFTVGDQVPFLGSNQGETLGDENFSWSLNLNHNEHQHFDELPPTSGESGAFVVPDHGDNTSLELCLRVMRGGNESDPNCVTLRLNTVEYTLDTEPSGLELSWEGATRTTPFTVTTNVNARQQLTALAEQEGLTFARWSDGGERIHDITVQNTPQTLTATYASGDSEPKAGESRYVRLVAESEVNGRPWTSAAELNVLDAEGNLLDQNAFRVQSSDSEEAEGEDGRASNAIDGDPATFWHTAWFRSNPAHPHEIVIDLGAAHEVGGLRYLPRQNGPNGRIADYTLYLSADGTSWEEVAAGTFENSSAEQTISLLTSVSTCGLTQEAEAGELFGAFRTVSSASASGGRYLDTPDGSGHQKTLNPAHRAEYCMNVAEPGRYKVTGWVQGARSSDSFFLAMDGTPANDRWDTPRNSSFERQDAARRNRPPFTFDLDAGEHTVTLYMREDGTRLDRLELVRVD